MITQKWWVLAAVACGTFMATLDSSIVNIALPSMTKALSADLSSVKWVVVLYLTAITCTLLPFGRLSDLYGRRRVFVAGFATFIVGSGLCGLSGQIGWLLFSRFIQGLGASMLMSNGPAIITSSFPSGERGKALGTLAMVVSIGLLSGPAVGGFLITHFGWPSIFLVNIPVGLMGLLLVKKFVAADIRVESRHPFDWVGTLLQSFFLLSVMFLVEPPAISFHPTSPVHDHATFPISRLLMFLLTIMLGAIFVKVESMSKAPLFDFSLLKIRRFWTANLAAYFVFVAFSSIGLLMPFFLEEVFHFTTDRAGLFMTAVPAVVFVIAPISGRLSDHVGSRELGILGTLMGSLGLFSLAGIFGNGISQHSSAISILIPLAMIGGATGFFQSPNNNLIMGVVPPNKLGIASALLATIRNLGLATGVSISTLIFTWRHYVTGDFQQALRFTFAVAGCFALLATVATIAQGRRP
ncbi:MAG: MFS transporter [Bdellovibrionales bacterium]|nr:MFS transporter [Bdellovibrionales bacterium]